MNHRMKPSMSAVGISEVSKLPAKPLFLSRILEIDDMEKPALYINHYYMCFGPWELPIWSYQLAPISISLGRIQLIVGFWSYCQQQKAVLLLIQPTSTCTGSKSSYCSSCSEMMCITRMCLCSQAFEEIGFTEISIIIRMVLILLISIMQPFILDY